MQSSKHIKKGNTISSKESFKESEKNKESDDDDITIDFSKFTSWFKEKKETKQRNKATHDSVEDESFDESEEESFDEDNNKSFGKDNDALKEKETDEHEDSEDSEDNWDDDDDQAQEKKPILKAKEHHDTEYHKAEQHAAEHHTHHEEYRHKPSEKDQYSHKLSEKNQAKHQHKKTSTDDGGGEDVNLDLSGIKNFFAKPGRKEVLIILLLILIPVILTIHIRLLPEKLPATDTWAESSVNSYLRNAIAQQVDQTYPNLPQQNKNVIINQEFTKQKESNQAYIQQMIQSTSQSLKSGFRYTENNHTYTFLGDLDSYYFLRQARNLEATGTICDEQKDGRCIDNHMMAPLGTEVAIYMHPYGIVLLYKLLHPLNNSINLMRASFYLPTVLAVIAVIAAFFIGRRLMNNVAGFFTSMFVALSPLFITRTLGSDTDVWNIMFPLIIMWIFLEAFEAKSLLKKIILGTLAGAFVGVFSFAWGGWWYVFDFILAAAVAYIIYLLLHSFILRRAIRSVVTHEIKFTALVLVIFVIASGIFVSLFGSFSVFSSVILAPFHLAASLKLASYATLWPNVYTTVAELNPASIDSIVNQVAYGMHIFFALALMGIIFTMVKRKPDWKEYLLMAFSLLLFLILISDAAVQMNTKVYLFILMLPVVAAVLLLLFQKDQGVDIKPAFILSIWFIGMIYASTQGVRFILLLIPAFSIALGVSIGYLYQYAVMLLEDFVKISKRIAKIGVFIILCLLLINPINIGIAAGESFVPSLTTGWWETLTKIRVESKPDAILNSWWDFGHWFKYVADRRVTLDGASQNHPNAHWLGKILQTNDEKEAIAIMKMLDCGSNNAFEEINKRYNDTLPSVELLKRLLLMNTSDDMRTELAKQGFNDAQITVIMNNIQCNPPEDYFITSEDMVGKAGVWAHFGLWNFKKSYVINTLKDQTPEEAIKLMQSELGYSAEEAKRLYLETQTLISEEAVNAWISPWPNYIMGKPIMCPANMNSSTITCIYMVGIGSQNGRTIVLEKADFNTRDYTNTTLTLGFYDPNTQQKIGDSIVKPAAVVVEKNNDLLRIPINDSTFSYDIVLVPQNTTVYQSLIASPELSESIFTRLFYLEGKYTTHFDKFSDITDITGSRIIVWKVRW